MWKWLATLPLPWQIILPLLLIAAIVYISIYGRLWLSYGKGKSIGIGSKNKKERDCMECTKEIRRLYDRARRDRRKSVSDADREKKNVVKQYLIMIQRKLDVDFTDMNKELHIESDLKIFRTRLKWAIFHVTKEELERSFAENGFHELEGSKLEDYIKKQNDIIEDLIENELILYYDNDVVTKLTDSASDSIQIYITNIYSGAKEIELKLETLKDDVDKMYDVEIDKYLGIKDKKEA